MENYQNTHKLVQFLFWPLKGVLLVIFTPNPTNQRMSLLGVSWRHCGALGRHNQVSKISSCRHGDTSGQTATILGSFGRRFGIGRDNGVTPMDGDERDLLEMLR